MKQKLETIDLKDISTRNAIEGPMIELKRLWRINMGYADSLKLNSSKIRTEEKVLDEKIIKKSKRTT